MLTYLHFVTDQSQPHQVKRMDSYEMGRFRPKNQKVGQFRMGKIQLQKSHREIRRVLPQR